MNPYKYPQTRDDVAGLPGWKPALHEGSSGSEIAMQEGDETVMEHPPHPNPLPPRERELSETL